MGNSTKTKRVIALFLLLGICIPLVLGAIGDVEIVGDMKLTTTGKGIQLNSTPGAVWIYPCTNPVTGNPGIKIPCLGSGAGFFLSTYSASGELVFISTASYDGDITDVWAATVGNVNALMAAAGDSLNATSADSTIPWKVNATAAPTVEGAAIWESDADSLKIGDGASTLTVAISGQAFHDNFSDFVAYEHIDWNSTTEDLLTTGSGTFGSVITGTLTVADGAVGTPSLGFSNATDVGWYLTGSVDNWALNVALDGVRQCYIVDNALGVKGIDSVFFGKLSFAGAMAADRGFNVNLNDGDRILSLAADLTVEATSVINQDLSSNSTTAAFTDLDVVTLDASGAITGLTYNGLTQSISLPGTWLISDGTSQLEVSASCDLDQNLSTVSDVTHNDLTITAPSNIYALSHDSFADFVAKEHIDWTDTTEDLLTIGTLTAAALTIAANGYIGCLGATTAIQIEADGDIVMSDDLSVTGTASAEQLTSTDDITMAGLLTNTPAAADASVISIAGDTNARTFAGGAETVFDFKRTIGGADTTAPTNLTMMNNYLTMSYDYTGASTGSAKYTRGVYNRFDYTGDWKITSGFLTGNPVNIKALDNLLTTTPANLLQMTVAKAMTVNLFGSDNQALLQSDFDIQAGSITANVYGGYFKGWGNAITITSGTPVINYYGGYFEAIGDNSASLTETVYGGYFTASGGDTNYAIYTNAGNIRLGGEVNTTEHYQVDGTQVVSTQQAHIVDADAAIAAAAGDPPTQAEFNALVTAYNDLATKFNTLLAAIDADAGHGLLAGAP